MKKELIIFSLISIFSVIPLNTKAAELKLVPETVAAGLGQSIKIDVVIDTKNEVVNAVSGSIKKPRDLEIEKMIDGWSIIGFWIKRPKLAPSSIDFSGIIPNGFKGTGIILSFFAKSYVEDEYGVNIVNPFVVSNDGLGTNLKTVLTQARFSFVKGVKANVTHDIADVTSPRPFSAIVAKNTDMFNGRYFLIFNTFDEGYGIDHYEIMETKDEFTNDELLNKKSGLEWRIAESPAEIEDQSLESFIYVKSLDRAGNSQIATLLPAVSKSNKQPTSYILFTLVIIFIITGGISMRYFGFIRSR